jgi:hypothetical protein
MTAGLLLVLVLAADAGERTGEDPRLQVGAISAFSPGSSGVNVALEGGKDGKKLTGRGTIGLTPQLALDLTLSGADFDDDAARSRLLQTHERTAGGTAAVGFAWTNFRATQRRREIAQVMAICSGADRQKKVEAEKKKKLEADQRYTDARDEADALRAAAETAARVGGAGGGGPEAAVLASLADSAAARAAKEETRVLKDFSENCDAFSDLTPEERARIDIAWRPSVLVTGRYTVSTQYTKFFDTATGTTEKELKFPWSAHVGVGVYVVPTLLVGVSVGYEDVRKAKPSSQLCQDQAVGGATTTPPTLNCTTLAVGTPVWKPARTGRLEVRQYLDAIYPGLAWNPAVSFAAEGGFSAAVHGDAFRLDLPLYVHFGSGDKAITIGAAYSHYVEDKEKVDEVSVFLASTFRLKDYGK